METILLDNSPGPEQVREGPVSRPVSGDSSECQLASWQLSGKKQEQSRSHWQGTGRASSPSLITVSQTMEQKTLCRNSVFAKLSYFTIAKHKKQEEGPSWLIACFACGDKENGGFMTRSFIWIDFVFECRICRHGPRTKL